MTSDYLSTLRSAAKAAPVEHELVCPEGHQVTLEHGFLTCTCWDDDGERETHPMRWDIADLVRSGRTRAKQFTTRYPEAEPFK